MAVWFWAMVVYLVGYVIAFGFVVMLYANSPFVEQKFSKALALAAMWPYLVVVAARVDEGIVGDAGRTRIASGLVRVSSATAWSR